MNKKENEFFATWFSMMQRCYNKKNHNYKRYGGRGIFVCDEWKDFYKFKDWAEKTIGHKTKKFTIDRKDNDGPYSPENCRWATPKEQVRHRRCTINLTIDGETKPFSEWCEIYGVPYNTARMRIVDRGWEPKEAVTTHVRTKIHQPEKRVNDRTYTINGVTRNITDWAKEYNVRRGLVYGRLRNGWSIEDALTIPPDKNNRVKKV